jgi:hypothetical protein
MCIFDFVGCIILINQRCLVFVAGSYGVLVPFYNSNFNGKIARFKWVAGLGENVQELDLEIDALNPDMYRGYRGGWSSLWQGVDF